jgi:uncharacterized protein YjiS (DUF1127 family)
MTLLNSNPTYSPTPHIGKRMRAIGRWFFHLLNEAVATFIAHREYQASLAILSRFSDRELRDMGLNRGQIGPALEDAAKFRASRQNP